MPPKRKRTDAGAQPAASGSRSTRSSTRLDGAAADANSANTTTTGKSKSKASAKSTINEASKKKAKGPKAQKKLEEHNESISGSEELEPLRKRGKTKKSPEPTTPLKRSAPPAVTCSEYSRSLMEKLFTIYADEEDPSIIGAEGLEKLCTDAKIPMEGGQPLLLAWLLGASDLGTFKKEDWLTGLGALKIDTLGKLSFALAEYDNLLISNMPPPKPHPQQKRSGLEPYNRYLTYWPYAADLSKAFVRFYKFVFLLAKAPQERNIDIEMAKAFWTVLLSEKYPIIKDLIEFINAKGTVKGVNKDLWAMTLDFCMTFNKSFEGFEADGAWPTLLDEFYAWKTTKNDAGNDGIDK